MWQGHMHEQCYLQGHVCLQCCMFVIISCHNLEQTHIVLITSSTADMRIADLDVNSDNTQQTHLGSQCAGMSAPGPYQPA